jgi:hypothetical protein
VTIVRYEPRGAARELFKTRDSEVVLAGPAGTGKSLAALFRVHLAALHNPGIRCLIARKTAVSLGSTTLVTYEKKVAADAMAAASSPGSAALQREAACYRYSNGSVIVVGGLDKPEKILSAEYDLVFVDEATELTETDWETIGTRLRNGILSWQQQIAACNPAHPTHWIKQRAERGQMRMLVSRHRDNPAYVNADGSLTEKGATTSTSSTPSPVSAACASATGVGGRRGADLRVVRRPCTSSSRSRSRTEWTRWIGVDFGYTNPMVMQWWAEDGDGRLYLYRETYRTQRLVEDHARDILLQVTKVIGEVPERTVLTAKDIREDVAAGLRIWTEPRPQTIICDHDAEDRATLERHLGMGTRAAHKTVKDGLDAVAARLRPAGDGRPRIFLCEDALVDRDPLLVESKKPTCTAEEIVGYVWDAQPGKQPKEQPVKADDHGMDTMRYAVAERDLVATPRVRWL